MLLISMLLTREAALSSFAGRARHECVASCVPLPFKTMGMLLLAYLC